MILIGWVLAAPMASAQCMATVDQDLNCNGVAEVDEPPVDLTDQRCLSNVFLAGPLAGTPYPNRDYYYDYGSYGCTIPIATFDGDNDGFGSGIITLPVGVPSPVGIFLLECDTCSTDEDCEAGFVCSTFSDGSQRCGSGLGASTCKVR